MVLGVEDELNNRKSPKTEKRHPIFKIFDYYIFFDKSLNIQSSDKIPHNALISVDFLNEQEYSEFFLSDLISNYLRKGDIIKFGILKDKFQFQNFIMIYLNYFSKNEHHSELEINIPIGCIELEFGGIDFFKNKEFHFDNNFMIILEKIIENSLNIMRKNLNFKLYQKGNDDKIYQILEK